MSKKVLFAIFLILAAILVAFPAFTNNRANAVGLVPKGKVCSGNTTESNCQSGLVCTPDYTTVPPKQICKDKGSLQTNETNALQNSTQTQNSPNPPAGGACTYGDSSNNGCPSSAPNCIISNQTGKTVCANNTQVQNNESQQIAASLGSSSNCSLINPGTWGACVVDAVTTGATKLVVAVLSFVIYPLSWFVLNVASLLVTWSVQLNETISSTGSLAQFGFKTALQFADLLLVVAVIVIAFGIMFKQPFGKKMLPRLIIIAVLLNFSYFFATLIIEIADKLMAGFLSAADAQKSWASFVGMFSSSNNPITPDILSTAGSNAVALLSPVASIIFTFIAFFTLAGIAVMYFIRYIVLTILITLLPLALVLYVLPIKIGKGSAWDRWVNEFTRWVTFGPVMAFFIWFAFSLLKYEPAAPQGGFINVFSSGIGNYIVIIGFLMGGLMIANELGIQGAKSVNGAVKSSSKWAQKRGGDYLKVAALTAGYKAPSSPGAKEKPSYAQRLSRNLAGVPILGGAATKISASYKSIDKLIEERKKELDNLDREALRNFASKMNPKITDQVTKAALASLLAEKGMTTVSDIDPEKLKSLIRAAMTSGNATPIFKNRPDLSVELGATEIHELMDSIKKIPAADASKISMEAFNSSYSQQIILGLTNGQLAQIGTHGSDEQRQKISDLISKLGPTKAGLPPKERNALDRIEKFTTNNPNYV
ncbi:MAG TPA: hypothetical protein VMU70_01025 [Candidatus Tyrphobacter sp.]|nr:hypothetical protein [Candidatus Tyrphobacter sp.]